MATGRCRPALWTKNSAESWKDRQLSAVPAGLMGIAPKDELEGMLAGQLMAAHHAAMECYRRAMLGEQTFEGRKENLNQAGQVRRLLTTPEVIVRTWRAARASVGDIAEG